MIPNELLAKYHISTIEEYKILCGNDKDALTTHYGSFIQATEHITSEIVEAMVLGKNIADYAEIIHYREIARKEIAKLTGESIPEADQQNPIASVEKKLDSIMEYMGLKVKPIGDGVYEVIKEEQATGDYTNPIKFMEGMNVEAGKFYIFDDENIWECIKSGVGGYTAEYFDIIE